MTFFFIARSILSLLIYVPADVETQSIPRSKQASGQLEKEPRDRL